jgi:hypothetical protein
MSRNVARHALIYAAYLALACIVTFPLITQLGAVIVGFEYGDGREMAHHLWWFGEALRTGQNPFFMANLAYPAGIDAITLWANPLQFFPAWVLALMLPVPLAANGTLLGVMALNGWAMYAAFSGLARGDQENADIAETHRNTEKSRQDHHPRGSAFTAAALVAGAVYMLFPTMQAHLGAGHAGLLVQFPTPLYALALIRVLEREDAALRRIGIAAVWFVISGWGHTLQLFYVTVPLTAALLLPPLIRRQWRALGRGIAVLLIGMAASALYLLPTFAGVFGAGTYADVGGGVRYSADLLAAFSPSFRHPVWGQLLDYPRAVLGVNLDEGAAYIGVIAGLLALIGLICVRAARVWGVYALIAYGLSLGALLKVFDQPLSVEIDGYISYITLPFAWIADLPIVNLMRAPGRFNFGLALALAIMAGYGVNLLFSPHPPTPSPLHGEGERVRTKTPPSLSSGEGGRGGEVKRNIIIGVVLAACIAFDYQTFAPLPTTSAAIPAPIRALADDTNVRAVLAIPYDNLVAAKAALYDHTAHHHPLIAGQVTRATPVDPARLAILQATLDPTLLGAAGADRVIVYRAYDDGTLFARAEAQLGAPIATDEGVAIFALPPEDRPPRPFASVVADPIIVTDASPIYLYAASPGWVEWSAGVVGGRAITLQMGGTPIRTVSASDVQADGRARIAFPVEAGYQTLTLTVDPPCPRVVPSDALMCDAVTLTAPTLTYSDDRNVAPAADAAFDRGVILARWRVQHQGEALSVWLDWRFAAALTTDDIRFVQLVAESGDVIAQSDVPLGDIAAGTRRVETVTLNLPADLPAGRHTIYGGWYTYPAIERFALLRAPAGADGRIADNLLVLGTIVVE